jgi:polysaccharide biosynthesis/export protein
VKQIHSARFSSAFFALLLLLPLSIAYSQPETQSSDLRIGPGDLIEVSVFESPELNTKCRVTQDGNISMPLIGTVTVAGQSAGDVQARIHELLVQGDYVRNPQVSVFVTEYVTQRVSVLGEVKRPGMYPALASHRLLDYISVAEGLTPLAGSKVLITPRDHPDESVTVSLLNNAAMPHANPEIRPGDTIMVLKAGIVYVIGDVAKPGGFVMDREERISALQALALAQGATRTASLSKARIIRRTNEGPQEIALDLKKVLSSKAPDRALVSDDILFVPGSATKSAMKRGIEAVLQTATGVVIYGAR